MLTCINPKGELKNYRCISRWSEQKSLNHEMLTVMVVVEGEPEEWLVHYDTLDEGIDVGLWRRTLPITSDQGVTDDRI